MILSSISDASFLIWFFVLSCFDLISSSVSTTIWSCAPLALPSQRFGAGAHGQLACCKSRGSGWPVSVPLACSCVPVCTGTFTFFSLYFFPLAHSCPASLGASEATGGEMPAVRQGERTSWCVFPQPEERGAKVKQGAIAGLGSRRIPA